MYNQKQSSMIHKHCIWNNNSNKELINIVTYKMGIGQRKKLQFSKMMSQL